MKVNITAGECLNRILEARYPDECFVPFNEAMNQGTYSVPLFSEEFVKERAAVHGVSEAEYRENLAGFLEVLARPEAYDEIVLWFGDEPFCVENRETVLAAFPRSLVSVTLFIVSSVLAFSIDTFLCNFSMRSVDRKSVV